MGGNLLKDITRRHSADEYCDKTKKILKLLNGEFSEVCAVGLIPAYYKKESYGDADIVYSTYDDAPIPIDALRELFSPTRITCNGTVTTFDFEELQVDLIHSEMECFNYAYLEETNGWDDKFWGVYLNAGENRLGHILMNIRSQYQNERK